MMGVEQQVAWQRLADEQEQNQMARDAALLKAEADKRTMELQRQETTQSTAMMSELPKLQEALLRGDDDEYLAVKADLVSRYPVGAGSAEAARALKAFDDRYARKANLQGEIDKARTTRQEIAKQRRDEALLKQAAAHGNQREVAALLADPLKGADDASELLAQSEQRSIVQSLKDANPNLTDQEIAQRYGTGKDFNYQAARQAPKSELSRLRERRQARIDLTAMEKARAESRFDPARAEKTGKDPYTNTTWTPDREQEYQDARAYLDVITPKIGENRAGVAGMGAREGESLYRGYVRPTPAVVTARPAPPAAAVPAAPREKTYRHPQTGERIALRNGKWEKI